MISTEDVITRAKEYMQHKGGCMALNGYGELERGFPCTCGLDTLLSTLSGPQEQVHQETRGDTRTDSPLPATTAGEVEPDSTGDDLGLSIDMLDVDRLREWARLILEHGSDMSHWGDRFFVVSKMQMIATGIEKAVREIGELRTARDRAEDALSALLKASEDVIERGYQENWIHYNGTDESRLDLLETAVSDIKD